MSMPVITASTTTRDQAVTDLIQSIALEETALSHILNAEGEKIQKVIAYQDVTPELLLATNKSVESMVNAVARLEMILQSKLTTLMIACVRLSGFRNNKSGLGFPNGTPAFFCTLLWQRHIIDMESSRTAST